MIGFFKKGDKGNAPEPARPARQVEDFCRKAIQGLDARLMDTAEKWLADAAFLEQAGELAVCRLVMVLTQVLDHVEPVRRQRLWESCLATLQGLENSPARADNSDRYTAECILLRHMGRMEQALEAAKRGIREHSSASNYAFAGICCLSLDKLEQAEWYIRKGLELDPENLAPCNDLADCLYDRRDFVRAGKYYALVLDRGDETDQLWAEPSLIFCRYMDTGDPLELERLALCAACRPDNGRAEELCRRARFERQTPYVDYLVPSHEAVVKMIPDLMKHLGQAAEARIGATYQEAPSGVNAVRLALGQYGTRPARVSMSIAAAARPPLKDVTVPGGLRLWDLEDINDPKPLVRRPGPFAARRVAELAGTPFRLGNWYRRGAELAGNLTAADLYSCLVYPAPPAAGTDFLAGEWLMRSQFAAMCLLAHVKGENLTQELENYAAGLPSPELVRVCLGQMDWPVIPAMTLLAWQAREDLADAGAVQAILDQVEGREDKDSDCFLSHPLACVRSWCPGKDAAFRQAMHRLRRELERN